MKYQQIQTIAIELLLVSTCMFSVTAIGTIVVSLSRPVAKESMAKEPQSTQQQETVLPFCSIVIAFSQEAGNQKVSILSKPTTQEQHTLQTEGSLVTPIAFECVAVKVYALNGSKTKPIIDSYVLEPQDKLYATVIGGTTQGIIDKARFRTGINQVYTPWKEVTDVTMYGEYVIQVTPPTETTEMIIEAQLHHSILGWH